MKYKDFVFIDVSSSLAAKEEPYTGRLGRLAAVYTSTKVKFLIASGLLKPSSEVRSTPHEEIVFRLSDLTEEGQDFVMSGAITNWLSACDRKSNKMLAQGTGEEERLSVYADPRGLYSRLEKFRKSKVLHIQEQ